VVGSVIKASSCLRSSRRRGSGGKCDQGQQLHEVE